MSHSVTNLAFALFFFFINFRNNEENGNREFVLVWTVWTFRIRSYTSNHLLNWGGNKQTFLLNRRFPCYRTSILRLFTSLQSIKLHQLNHHFNLTRILCPFTSLQSPSTLIKIPYNNSFYINHETNGEISLDPSKIRIGNIKWLMMSHDKLCGKLILDLKMFFLYWGCLTL